MNIYLVAALIAAVSTLLAYAMARIYKISKIDLWDNETRLFEKPSVTIPMRLAPVGLWSSIGCFVWIYLIGFWVLTAFSTDYQINTLLPPAITFIAIVLFIWSMQVILLRSLHKFMDR